MPIIESQLVEGHILQDYFVDKSTGLPLSAGIVTLYVDSSRQTLKNWYYQDGSYPNYSFKALPNPLVLSAVGTVQDVNGNDVIPFYYPFVEDGSSTPQSYYITIDNSQGLRQFTRQNFPFISQSEQPIDSTFDNLIVNNRFWRNVSLSNGTTPQTLPLTNSTNIVVCPSQHDGFHEPDIRFKKTTTGGGDSVTFSTFPAGSAPFSGAIRPEYFLNHKCSTTTTGDVGKYYQFPISLHIKTLDSVSAVFSMWAKGNGSNVNNILGVQLVQYLGSDLNIENTKSIGTPVTLTNSWEETQSTFTFQSSSGQPTSSTGDDAFFLRILLPDNVDFDIDFAIPSIYLGNTVPTTDFKSYDQIDPIINGQRTGDVKMSLNSFNQFGWVPADDGTIGNFGSGASSRQSVDTWPLFNLLYNNVLDTWAPVSGGRTGPASTALGAWQAGRTIKLTRMLGRIMAGLNPTVAAVSFTTNHGVSNTNLLVSSTSTYLTGSPIQLVGASLPTGLTTGIIYYAIVIDATTLALASTIENAYSSTKLTFSADGSGTVQNALGAFEGESLHTMTLNELVSHNHTPLGGGSFVTDQTASDVLTGTGSRTTKVVPTTSSTGNTVPFNVKQPTTMLNMMIKL